MTSTLTKSTRPSLRWNKQLRWLLVDSVQPLEGTKSDHDEDLKLSFYGENPDHFVTVIVNLRQLIHQQIAESGSDPNAIQRRFLSSTWTNGTDRLKFCYVLFEVCSRRHRCHKIMVLTYWIHRNLTRTWMSQIRRQNLILNIRPPWAPQ